MYNVIINFYYITLRLVVRTRISERQQFFFCDLKKIKNSGCLVLWIDFNDSIRCVYRSCNGVCYKSLSVYRITLTLLSRTTLFSKKLLRRSWLFHDFLFFLLIISLSTTFFYNSSWKVMIYIIKLKFILTLYAYWSIIRIIYIRILY